VVIPEGISQAPSEVIKRWLKGVGMEQYAQQFLESGYFDMLLISTLEEVCGFAL